VADAARSVPGRRTGESTPTSSSAGWNIPDSFFQLGPGAPGPRAAAETTPPSAARVHQIPTSHLLAFNFIKKRRFDEHALGRNRWGSTCARDRQVQPKSRVDSRHQASADQRVAAQSEKVVMDADRIDRQHFPPKLNENLFDIGSRRDKL